MRLVAALVLASSLACASSTEIEKKPPAWVPVTLFCLACVGPPTAAVAGALLLGPNEKVEGYTAKMEGSPYSGKEVGLLIDTLYDLWDAKFHNGPKIRPFLDRVDIVWLRGSSEIDGVPTVLDTMGRPSAGFFDKAGTDPLIHRGRVRVTWRSGFPLGSTALAHELVHGFLLITTGNADSDHLEEVYGTSWTQEVQDVVVETMRLMADGEEPRAHPLANDVGDE
jgi:hypothetical protein